MKIKTDHRSDIFSLNRKKRNYICRNFYFWEIIISNGKKDYIVSSVNFPSIVAQDPRVSQPCYPRNLRDIWERFSIGSKLVSDYRSRSRRENTRHTIPFSALRLWPRFARLCDNVETTFGSRGNRRNNPPGLRRSKISRSHWFRHTRQFSI